WNIRSSVDPKQSLLSLLYKMVRNQSLNHLRDQADSNISLDESPPEALKTEAFIEEEDNGQQITEKMLSWVEALPKRQCEAIKLSRFEGLDHDEIACVMQISPRTVNNHIVEALKTLKKEWRAYRVKHA